MLKNTLKEVSRFPFSKHNKALSLSIPISLSQINHHLEKKKKLQKLKEKSKSYTIFRE